MGFGELALVVAAGLFGPLLAGVRPTGPPILVGEIIAGLAIGPHGLGWIHPDRPVLAGLASIGFALLMFIVGTHLPLRDKSLRPALVGGLGLVATIGALAALAGTGLAHVVDLHRPAILAVLLATSSAAVALPIVQGLGSSDRPILLLTTWIAVADIATVLAVPIVMATGSLTRVLTGAMLVAVAALAMFEIASSSRSNPGVAAARRLSRQRGWALDLRVSLLVLFSLAWLATRFGSSILLAGFATGAVVSLLGEPRRVAEQLVGLGEGFAIPFFFVHLGSQLDVGAMFRSSNNIALAVILASSAVTMHVVTAIVWRLPMGAGLIASAQLGVPAAIVSVGLANHALQPGQGAAIMASVLCTLVAGAVGSVLLGTPTPMTDASAPIDPKPATDIP